MERCAGRGFTHLDAGGNAVMVDVGGKEETRRKAVARAEVVMEPDTLRMLKEGAVPKGDALAVARVAGIMAAKRTASLIPLCHPVEITRASVEFSFPEGRPALEIEAAVECIGRTGVEMEALTAASVAALTVYDMCKSLDRGMAIGPIRLVFKSGGRSGTYRGVDRGDPIRNSDSQ
ncbi:MAG: cyclic pyranopterin monophosphate synthase MoaC [Firmicutes bacterium]|jgi:cyclic pyranopterin phosphate synthase|nr:cyclic pyranopterin monophosphate synthase MoaC [Bacillota bacterium]